MENENEIFNGCARNRSKQNGEIFFFISLSFSNEAFEFGMLIFQLKQILFAFYFLSTLIELKQIGFMLKAIFDKRKHNNANGNFAKILQSRLNG